MSPFPSLHSLNRHLWARIPHTLHCAANAPPDDANWCSIRIRGFEFGIKMSRSKLPLECLQWSTTHTHQPSHRLCYALMRQEHEGCMCITNVIPSHQMVQVFTANKKKTQDFPPSLLHLLSLIPSPSTPLVLCLLPFHFITLHLASPLLFAPFCSSSVPVFQCISTLSLPPSSPSCALKQDSLSSINSWSSYTATLAPVE